ncbi:MAG TPA: acyl-CoA dehydrogenase family protein, partial [Microlunatus sp.]|nr:acyl-CoA dehydrogenase family protein [Microlunatus sp.]
MWAPFRRRGGRLSTFQLSEEHEDFRAVVREFAEAELAPHVAHWN